MSITEEIKKLEAAAETGRRDSATLAAVRAALGPVQLSIPTDDHAPSSWKRMAEVLGVPQAAPVGEYVAAVMNRVRERDDATCRLKLLAQNVGADDGAPSFDAIATSIERVIKEARALVDPGATEALAIVRGCVAALNVPPSAIVVNVERLVARPDRNADRLEALLQDITAINDARNKAGIANGEACKRLEESIANLRASAALDSAALRELAGRLAIVSKAFGAVPDYLTEPSLTPSSIDSFVVLGAKKLAEAAGWSSPNAASNLREDLRIVTESRDTLRRLVDGLRTMCERAIPPADLATLDAMIADEKCMTWDLSAKDRAMLTRVRAALAPPEPKPKATEAFAELREVVGDAFDGVDAVEYVRGKEPTSKTAETPAKSAAPTLAVERNDPATLGGNAAEVEPGEDGGGPPSPSSEGTDLGHIFGGGDPHRQCLRCRAQNPRTTVCPGEFRAPTSESVARPADDAAGPWVILRTTPKRGREVVAASATGTEWCSLNAVEVIALFPTKADAETCKRTQNLKRTRVCTLAEARGEEPKPAGGARESETEASA